MTVRSIRPRAAALCLFVAVCAASCASLEREPWAKTKSGEHSLTLLTGTTAYEAEIDVTAEDGPIAGLSDSAESTLDPEFGVQLEYGYFVADDFSLGAAAGARRFDPDSVELFGAGFDGDSFWTTHLYLTSRYFLPAFGDEERWRVYLGLDLGYVPAVDLDATVDYGGGFTQDVSYEGDAFWQVAMRAAIACLLTDRLSVELGSQYEIPLDSSDDTITLDIPGAGTSNVASEILPEGFVFFLALTYGF